VPAVAASTTLMTDVAWVGIGGSKSRDLIQAGTQGAVQNGRVQYWAWYELLPDFQIVLPLVVAAGDKVSVSLTEMSEDLWFLSFENNTTGAAHYQVLEYNSKYTSAEWIQEMPTVTNRGGERLYAPLAEFGAITFTDGWAVVDGKRKSIEDARGRAVTMTSREGRVPLAIPLQLNEDSFTVVRTSAVPSPAIFVGSGKRNRANPADIVWSRAQ